MSAVATSPIDQSLLRRYKRDVLLFAKEVLGVEPTVKQAFFFFEVATNRATEFVWRNNEGSTTALAILAVWRFLVFSEAAVLTFTDNPPHFFAIVRKMLCKASNHDASFLPVTSKIEQKKHSLSVRGSENIWFIRAQKMPEHFVTLAGWMRDVYFLVDKDVFAQDSHKDVMLGSVGCFPESRLAISLRGIA